MVGTAASAKPTTKPDITQPTTERGATTDGGSTGVKGNRTATPTTGENPPSVERGHKDNTVPGGGTGKRLLPILGAAAAIGGIIAVASGSNSPTSP